MNQPPPATFMPALAQAPPPGLQQPPPEAKPRKFRRITRACDYCHKRSIRCKPTENEDNCQNCLDFGIACTSDRPRKKRGTKSGFGKHAQRQDASSSHDEKRDARMLLELTNGVQLASVFDGAEASVPEKWRMMVEGHEAKIRGLVDVYFEVIYPIFPIFHTQTMLKRISNREYLTDHAFFADVMALCALSSERVRDGALFPGRWEPEYFQNPPSELFFAAAKDSIPQDLTAMRGLDWLRTCGLLALYGIQVGKINIMHQYLGLYHTLVAMHGLHDEKNWPKNIGIIEVELRRRQFWSMYTLEVFSSVVWGTMVRCRESQCLVNYPSEVEDELFSDAGYPPTTQQIITNPSSWLHGWNFTTELYRILEHAVDEYHRRRPNTIRPISAASLFTKDCPGQNVVMSKVMEMYNALPQRFKGAKLIPETGPDGLEDKLSFQAANITATLLLVRMMLFTTEDVTVEQKCTIARELLDGFAKVPLFFLRAISSPLLHQLAGIGSILGSVIEGPLSESSYMQVRDVLLSMADLLSSLENGMTRVVGAASRIRSQISMIEDYMKTQRQQDLAASNPGYLKTDTSAVTNPNIDPSLQAPLNVAGLYQPQNTFGFKGDFSSGVEGMNVGINQPGDDQFQLPPELLEGWPWPFGMSQGFSGV